MPPNVSVPNLSPFDKSLLGAIIILFKDLHPFSEFSSIHLTPLGISIELTLLQFALSKAPSLSFFTVRPATFSGITTDPFRYFVTPTTFAFSLDSNSYFNPFL